MNQTTLRQCVEAVIRMAATEAVMPWKISANNRDELYDLMELHVQRAEAQERWITWIATNDVASCDPAARMEHDRLCAEVIAAATRLVSREIEIRNLREVVT